MRRYALAVLVVWLAVGTHPSMAVEGAATTATPGSALRRFVTRHQGLFQGRRVSYTVVAAETPQNNEAGELIGTIFSFSYLEEGVPASHRPVTFVFNGGPGSSSVWLNLGGIGPRRAVLHDTARDTTAPFDLIDNPDSPLATSDLVFIDPVGTGFSRFRGKGTAADFFGSNQDASSIARFIERWLTDNDRWDSPKFVMGESYGTVRANLLATVLMGGSDGVALRGISLNGVILLGHDGGLVPLESERRFQTNFTTMAASAWYHNRVDHAGRSFEQFIAAAGMFAATELGPALEAGLQTTSNAGEMTRLSDRMATFIGLSPAYIRASGLRISSVAFSRELLRDRGLELSLFDARYTLPTKAATDPVGLNPTAPLANAADDPLVAQIGPAIAGAFHSYLVNDLHVRMDEPYILLADLEDQWKNKGARLDPVESLIGAMRRNPALQVMFGGGWYDVLAGTVGAAEYGSATRLPRGRVIVKAYAAGHMVYLGQSVKPFCQDVAEFISKASAPR